jgi:cytochrome c oxidase cbb3-type subunit III
MQKENYERHFIAGLIITVLLLAGLTIAWIYEPARMEHLKEEMNKESALRGREIYGEQCALCHGSSGQGAVASALNSKNFLENASDQIMFETVRAGRPGTIMPAWAQDNGGPLTDEDIRDLVNFMRFWEENAPEVAGDELVPDASRGLILFNSSCFICHGENGVGGDVAPAINDPSRLENLDNDWYRGVISFGRPAKGMPTWGTVLSPNQIEDLIALIEAWRAEESVVSETKVSEMLNAALFELSQGDVEDTVFYLDRAERIVFGPILADFKIVRNYLDDEQLDDAFEHLEKMNSEWPFGNAEEGEAVYMDSCSKCHGAEGEGDAGSRLRPNEFMETNTNSQLLAFFLSGREGTMMGGFDGRLTEEQIANVIAYLRQWQLND